MKKVFAVLFAIVGVLFVPTLAHAEMYDEATIVNVTESYRTVRTNQRECYNEEVAIPQRQSQGQDRSLTGAIVGGAAGGLLGNTVGKGRGKTGAAVAGAIIGAIAGDRIDNDSPQRDEYYSSTRTEQQCRYVPRETSQLDGYDVTYMYQGMTETVHMQRPPRRDTIRVRITPVF